MAAAGWVYHVLDDAGRLRDCDAWVQRVLGIAVVRPAASGVPDAALLSARLRELVAQMRTEAGAQQPAAALKALATNAALALKDGRIAAAVESIAALATAMGGARTGPPATEGAPPLRGLAGSSASWAATCASIAEMLDAMRTAITEYFAEENMAGELSAAFERKVMPLRTILSGTLATALTAAETAVDGAAQAAALTTIRTTLDEYRDLLAADGELPQLDELPFAPGTPFASLHEALEKLQGSIA